MGTKVTGMGDGLWWAGVDVSGSIMSVGRIGGGPALATVPDITMLAQARIGLTRTGTIEASSYFTPSDHHPTFAALPTTNTLVVYRHRNVLGNPAACLWARQLSYDPNRGADGSLSFSLTSEGDAYGLEWGRQGTAGLRTDGAATDGASVDDGAASASGLAAYLTVTAFTGTSVTVKLQQSSDNGVGDAWADVTGGGFTAVSTAGAFQRIQTATNLAVERYLRVVTTGTFSNVEFGVVIVRYETAVE